MAIGGQVIVPIRDANGNKVSLTTNRISLKPGTWNKIIRAINLQKELVFEDLIVYDHPVTSASNLTFNGNYIDSIYGDVITIGCNYLTTQGTSQVIPVKIYADDTVYTGGIV